MFYKVPHVAQDMATHLIAAVINILVALGVVIDPTIAGTSGSEQDLMYKKLKKYLIYAKKLHGSRSAELSKHFVKTVFGCSVSSEYIPPSF